MDLSWDEGLWFISNLQAAASSIGKQFKQLIILALPTGTVQHTGPKCAVTLKAFPLLNVNAIDLLYLIKLSGYFCWHNLDKKMTIPPRLRKNPLALFLIWCNSAVVVLPSL